MNPPIENEAQVRLLSAVALVWNQEGQLLMGFNKQRDGYELAGCKVKPTEHPRDAVKRELWEEANVVGHLYQFLGFHICIPGWVTCIYSCSVLKAPNPLIIPEPEIHADWGWLDKYPLQISQPMQFFIDNVFKGKFPHTSNIVPTQF